MKSEKYQSILNWLDKEKKKDKIQLEKNKSDFIKEIKSINKEEIFRPKEIKLTLWQKIRKVIWGY
jgi:hypothetical protein